MQKLMSFNNLKSIENEGSATGKVDVGKELLHGRNYGDQIKAMEVILIKQGEQIRELNSQIYGDDTGAAKRRIKTLKSGPALVDSSLALTYNGANPGQSLDTRASMTQEQSGAWKERYEYLKEQLQGVIGSLEEIIDAMYFDWIIEVERPMGSVMRYIEIMESLTRYGTMMSQTQLMTLVSRIRQRVTQQNKDLAPLKGHAGSINRISLIFTGSEGPKN